MVPNLSGLHPAILAQLTRRPDATNAELRAWLLETHKVSASIHAAEQAREDVAKARVEWRE